MEPQAAASDSVSDALDEMERAVEDNIEEERMLVNRVRALRAAHRAGGSWGEILEKEEHPGLLPLVGRVLHRMSQASGLVRRALARALRAEGETIPAIARRFGVTHQRISSLLRGRGR